VTSVAHDLTCPPSAVICPTTLARASSRRAPSTTRAPCAASSLAVAAPIPALAPVIAMTWLFVSMVASSGRAQDHIEADGSLRERSVCTRNLLPGLEDAAAAGNSPQRRTFEMAPTATQTVSRPARQVVAAWAGRDITSPGGRGGSRFLLTRAWPSAPAATPRGGSPRPAGSVPRGARRPGRDSSSAPPQRQEKIRCHSQHPPTTRR
jgi:hypothetical protein